MAPFIKASPSGRRSEATATPMTTTATPTTTMTTPLTRAFLQSGAPFPPPRWGRGGGTARRMRSGGLTPLCAPPGVTDVPPSPCWWEGLGKPHEIKALMFFMLNFGVLFKRRFVSNDPCPEAAPPPFQRIVYTALEYYSGSHARCRPFLDKYRAFSNLLFPIDLSRFREYLTDWLGGRTFFCKGEPNFTFQYVSKISMHLHVFLWHLLKAKPPVDFFLQFECQPAGEIKRRFTILRTQNM